MNRETENWSAMSQYDLDTAEHMLQTGRFLYVVFMCHMAIEKALKAIVCEATNAAPPRIHDLEKLAARGGVQLEQRLHDFIIQLSDASIATRYPDDLAQAAARYTESVAMNYLQLTREVITCLRADPRLKPPSTATSEN